MPAQEGVHQPKVLPPVVRGQAGKKGKSPMINVQATKSFQLNSHGATKKISPTANDTKEGHLRRLS